MSERRRHARCGGLVDVVGMNRGFCPTCNDLVPERELVPDRPEHEAPNEFLCELIGELRRPSRPAGDATGELYVRPIELGAPEPAPAIVAQPAPASASGASLPLSPTAQRLVDRMRIAPSERSQWWAPALTNGTPTTFASTTPLDEQILSRARALLEPRPNLSPIRPRVGSRDLLAGPPRPGSLESQIEDQCQALWPSWLPRLRVRVRRLGMADDVEVLLSTGMEPRRVDWRDRFSEMVLEETAGRPNHLARGVRELVAMARRLHAPWNLRHGRYDGVCAHCRRHCEMLCEVWRRDERTNLASAADVMIAMTTTHAVCAEPACRAAAHLGAVGNVILEYTCCGCGDMVVNPVAGPFLHCGDDATGFARNGRSCASRVSQLRLDDYPWLTYR